MSINSNENKVTQKEITNCLGKIRGIVGLFKYFALKVKNYTTTRKENKTPQNDLALLM
jgi:hypothetical protein